MSARVHPALLGCLVLLLSAPAAAQQFGEWAMLVIDAGGGHANGANCTTAGEWPAGVDAAGAVESCASTLPANASPVIDGQITWDTTTESLKVGDDGAATLEFVSGAHDGTGTDTLDDLSDDLITALSGVTTVTDGSYCQGGAASTMDCDVTQANIAGADHIDALSEIATALKSGTDAELITGTIATTNAVVAPDANDDLVEYASLVWNVTAATCTGDGNGGALTIVADEIVCSADDGGGGSPGGISGDIQMNDGASGFSAAALNDDGSNITATEPILLPAGTEGLPALAFAARTSIGFFDSLHVSGRIGFHGDRLSIYGATGATMEIMRVNTSNDAMLFFSTRTAVDWQVGTGVFGTGASADDFTFRDSDGDDYLVLSESGTLRAAPLNLVDDATSQMAVVQGTASQASDVLVVDADGDGVLTDGAFVVKSTGKVLVTSSGSATDPSIGATADENTGWAWLNNDTLIGVTGGKENFRMSEVLNSGAAPLGSSDDGTSHKVTVLGATGQTADTFLVRSWAGAEHLKVQADGEVVTSGAATIGDILTLTPKVTAPATCSIGDVYSDTSGALCHCSATNTWEALGATGTCV